MSTPAHAGVQSPATLGLIREVVNGARDMAPLVLGILPFGLVVGSAVSASSEPFVAWSASLPIYGGSAQLATLEPLSRGASALAAAGIGVLVNLRVAVYATGLAPLWTGSRWWVRTLGALTTIEQTWIVAEHRAMAGGPLTQRRAHYAGAAGLLSLVWLVAVSAGAMSARVDALAPLLAVVLPVGLAYLALPHLKRAGGPAAMAVAAVTFVAAHAVLPAGLDILLAMGAAAAAGLRAQSRRSGGVPEAVPPRSGKAVRR